MLLLKVFHVFFKVRDLEKPHDGYMLAALLNFKQDRSPILVFLFKLGHAIRLAVSAGRFLLDVDGHFYSY